MPLWGHRPPSMSSLPSILSVLPRGQWGWFGSEAVPPRVQDGGALSTHVHARCTVCFCHIKRWVLKDMPAEFPPSTARPCGQQDVLTGRQTDKGPPSLKSSCPPSFRLFPLRGMLSFVWALGFPLGFLLGFL